MIIKYTFKYTSKYHYDYEKLATHTINTDIHWTCVTLIILNKVLEK